MKSRNGVNLRYFPLKVGCTAGDAWLGVKWYNIVVRQRVADVFLRHSVKKSRSKMNWLKSGNCLDLRCFFLLQMAVPAKGLCVNGRILVGKRVAEFL